MLSMLKELSYKQRISKEKWKLINKQHITKKNTITEIKK